MGRPHRTGSRSWSGLTHPGGLTTVLGAGGPRLRPNGWRSGRMQAGAPPLMGPKPIVSQICSGRQADGHTELWVRG